MSRLLNFILIIGLAATVVYLVWFKKPDTNFTYIERTTNTVEKAPPQPPIRRLSGFVDAHVDRIFSPLSEKDVIVPSQELRQIRATLADLSSTNNERDRRLYLAGITLCDQSLHAISRREDYARRMADAAAKRPVSLESDASRRNEDIQRKWRFFHDGIMRGWASESVTLRTQIAKQYDYVRLLER